MLRCLASDAAAHLLTELGSRDCPVCGSKDQSDLFADQKLDLAGLDESSFASRKRPEHMRLRLVNCPVCDLVYASPAPSPEALAAAYAAASFDSAEEAVFAARTYGEELARILPRLPRRGAALDIGTGEGAALAELKKLGFAEVVGVEPSEAPIAAAAPEIRPLILQGMFDADLRPKESLDLVTCFQTIEHVPDPLQLVRDARELLVPGGLLVIVCHDRRSPVNRLLGLRSPIVDIEHLQIFSPASATELLRRGGIRELGRRAIRNRYPIRYWARLSPLPDRPQAKLDALLERSGLAGRSLTLPVGNLIVWGVRD